MAEEAGEKDFFAGFAPAAPAAPEEDFFAGFAPAAPAEEEPSRGVFGTAGLVAEETGRAIVTAPVTFAQGLLELGSGALDLAFDTSFQSDVSDAFEYVKDYIEPQTAGGKIAEDVLVFGASAIPVLGVLSRANAVAKGAALPAATGRLGQATNALATQIGTKAAPLVKSKAALLGTSALTLGAYEALITSGGRGTLSDSFDALPDFLETESLDNLSGRQRAAADFRNRLRKGAEAAAFSGLVDTAATVGGATARQLGRSKVVGDGLSSLARGYRAGLAKAATAADAVPAVKASKQQLAQWFSSTKGMDPEAALALEDAMTRATGQQGIAAKAVERGLQKSHSALLRSLDRLRLRGVRNSGWDKAQKDMYSYFVGALDDADIDRLYGTEVRKNWEIVLKEKSKAQSKFFDKVEELATTGTVEQRGIANRFLDASGRGTEKGRAKIRQMRAQLEAGTLSGAQKRTAEKMVMDFDQMLQDADRKYFSREYELYKNPVSFYKSLGKQADFRESKNYKDAVRDTAGYFARGTSRSADDYLDAAEDFVLESMGLSSIKGPIKMSPKEALSAAKKQAIDKLSGAGTFGVRAFSSPLLKLHPEMTVDRQEIFSSVPSLRILLGEITDPKDAVLTTINKLSETTAAMDFYRDRAASMVPLNQGIEMLNEGRRPFAIQIPRAEEMPPVFSRDGATASEALRRQVQPLGKALPEDVADLRSQAAALRNSGDPADAARANALQAQSDVMERNLYDPDVFARELERLGYVRLGTRDPDSLFGGQFGELTGTYVPKEVARGLSVPIEYSAGPLGHLMAMLYQIKGLSQRMMVIPNVPSRVRDIMGNILYVGASGNAPSLRGMDLGTSWRVLTRDLAALDEPAEQELKKAASLMGIDDASVVLNEIKALGKEAPGDFAPTGYVKKTIDAYQGLPVMKQVLGAFEKTAQGTDFLSKMQVLLGEEAKLDKAFQKGVSIAQRFGQRLDPAAETDFYDYLVRQGVDPRRTSSVLADDVSSKRLIAANRTKNFTPTYNRIGTFVRELDLRLPTGNFTSFAAENIRNSFAILQQGLRELSAVADDELIQAFGKEGAEAIVREIRADGSHRLLSYLGTAALLPTQIARLTRRENDVTDEQELAAKRLSADWSAGHDYAFLNFDGKGRGEIVDLSYVMPFSYVTDPMKLAIERYYEAGQLDKSTAQQLLSAAYGAVFDGFSDPFLSESMVAERLLDVTVRDGRTKTGAKIYRDSDDQLEKLTKGLGHVLDVLRPQATSRLIEPGRANEEILKPGNLIRSATGIPTEKGRVTSVFEDVAKQLTGFTPMEINVPRDFFYRVEAYKPLRSDAKTGANSALVAPDTTPEQQTAAWNDYLDGLYRAQSELYLDAQAALTLGASRSDVLKSMIVEGGLGKAEAVFILDGKFFPTFADKEIAEKVAYQTNVKGFERLTPMPDLGGLSRLSADRLGQPLAQRQQSAPAAEEDFFAGFAPAAAGTPAAPTAAPPVPAIESVPVPAAPQPPRTPAGQPPAPMELLGADPVSQARNAEIQRRLQQQ